MNMTSETPETDWSILADLLFFLNKIKKLWQSRREKQVLGAISKSTQRFMDK